MISASALKPHCAYPSVLKAGKVIPPDQQKAIDRGVAFHAAVEEWTRTGVLPTVEDPEIYGWLMMVAADLWPSELGAECEIAWGLWADGRYTPVDEPMPHVYVASGEYSGHPLLTGGRADLAWVASHDTLFVLDWKTGKWPVPPADQNLQVQSAGMALAQRAGVKRYRPGISYPRDGFIDWGDAVEMGSPTQLERLAEVIEAANLPPLPRPGDWCASCWERKACPAGGRRV